MPILLGHPNLSNETDEEVELRETKTTVGGENELE